VKYRILIPDLLTESGVEENVLGNKYEVLTPNKVDPKDIADEIWSSVDAILMWHEMSLSPVDIDKLEKCQCIVRIGVGFDNVDIKVAGENGIYVCNVPDYGTEDIANHAIGLFLSLARGIYEYSEKVRASNVNWNWQTIPRLRRVTGAVFGTIGFGRIGKATALRAKALGMRVVFYDPYIEDGNDKALGVERCETLNELLEISDVVSMHTPLNDETSGIVNMSFVRQMKPGALLINTARGGLMKEEALEWALREDHLAGIGLDVYPEEPLPESSFVKAWRAREEWAAYRMVITPHAAFYCHEAYQEMREKAARTAKRVIEEGIVRNCVNKVFLSSTPTS
jgi:phosphoglycerate dehydrogenase-like enzyme